MHALCLFIDCFFNVHFKSLMLIQVRQGEKMHQLQHYQYTKWPDHGIPAEAISIAQMLSHFQSHHVKGKFILSLLNRYMNFLPMHFSVSKYVQSA